MGARPILWEDLRSLARALLAHPAARRETLALQISEGARRAARYGRITGRCHPRWGDGSLDAAARRFVLAQEPFLNDPDYRRCLMLALQHLASHDP